MIYKDERTHHVKLLQHAENFRELVKDYPVEEHIVRTRDSYLLGIQRIPHGRIIPDGNKNSHFSSHRASQDSISSLYYEDYGWPPAQNLEDVESVFRRCGIPLMAIRHSPEDEEVIASGSNTGRSTKPDASKRERSRSYDDSKSSKPLFPGGHKKNKSKKTHITKPPEFSDTHGEERAPSSRSSTRQKTRHAKPVVLLYHGLLTCSEIWVCNYEYENRLTCLLADAGQVVYN
ncbi:4286_t:CDS:2 [Acaulospora colombiana]|uniref:4286_t:CDS:1 n=1 Tax=Acaulospora colombiana TaxID=27376 RepID=A0ACA9K5I1_9GLOM|nr:4286_t:CDS:2 [Acaulospora colombiana]